MAEYRYSQRKLASCGNSDLMVFVPVGDWQRQTRGYRSVYGYRPTKSSVWSRIGRSSSMKILKNYSRQGRLFCTIHRLHSMEMEVFPFGSHEHSLVTRVRILFTPDGIENRQPIYYAACAGHSMLVKAYLSFFLLARMASSTRHKKEWLAENWCKEQTFDVWLRQVGYFHFFTKQVFDDCVLNALNDEVRNVFQGTKVSLDEIFKTCQELDTQWVRHFRNKYHIPSGGVVRSAIESSKKSLAPPSIHCQSELTCDLYPDEDIYHTDFGYCMWNWDEDTFEYWWGSDFLDLDHEHKVNQKSMTVTEQRKVCTDERCPALVVVSKERKLQVQAVVLEMGNVARSYE